MRLSTHYGMMAIVMFAAVCTVFSGQPRRDDEPVLAAKLMAAIPVDHETAIDVDLVADDWMPINLSIALRLAQTNNLDIAQARAVVDQAGAILQRARVQVLPNLNIGSTYVHHEGNIQRTEGNIIRVNRDSLFVGGGPGLTMSFADAVFAPLVARQLRTASQAGLQRVNNDTLLAVSDAYFNVLRARRRLARVEATLEFLTSKQPAKIRSDSKGLLPVVEAMQQVGAAEALKAEVERVLVEVQRRREERAAAIQELRIAATELARLLRLDPQTRLWPMEDFRVPMEIPGPWFSQSPEDLVRLALVNRPELAENQALVQAAVERVRTARFRPFLPNVILNYNWGDFGGGPELMRSGTRTFFGNSGRITHFEPRTDFDVSLFGACKTWGSAIGPRFASRKRLPARRIFGSCRPRTASWHRSFRRSTWCRDGKSGWRSRGRRYSPRTANRQAPSFSRCD